MALRRRRFTQHGAVFVPAPGGGGYTGPGDVVSGASGWWGLRAYSAAAAGGNCVDIKRASDNTTQTFVTLANGNLDVASIATFLAATTGTVVQLYDQTGNGMHLTVSTTAPAFTLSGIGSLPVMTYSSGNNLSKATGFSLTQPYSLSAVFNSTATTGTVFINGTNPNPVFGFYSAATVVTITAGTNFSVTETPNNWYAVQGIPNGASSTLYINGSSNSGNAGTGNWSNANPINSGTDGFGDHYVGKIVEFGAWAAAFNGTQQSNMNSNQRAYWGF